MTVDEQTKSNKVYILKAKDDSKSYMSDSYVSSYEGDIFKFKDDISEAKYFTFNELVIIHLKYSVKFEYLEIDLTPKPIDIKINLDYKNK